MRKFTLGLLIFFLHGALAQESFSITGLQEKGREGVYALEHSGSEDLTIDCASFLFGITVEDGTGRDFFYLYESECYEIITRIRQWSQGNQKSCLSLDWQLKEWLLEKQAGDCPAAAGP